jgi:hypothetical protein
MIAALICAFSLLGLVQFFIAFCRLQIAASSGVVLSEQTRSLAGIHGNRVEAKDFPALMALVRLCPELNRETRKLDAVRIYFRLLGLAEHLLRRVNLEAAGWAYRERAGCAQFAVAELDRRIARSRELVQQATETA